MGGVFGRAKKKNFQKLGGKIPPRRGNSQSFLVNKKKTLPGLGTKFGGKGEFGKRKGRSCPIKGKEHVGRGGRNRKRARRF